MDDRSQGRRFSRTGRARDQNQSTADIGQVSDLARQAQGFLQNLKDTGTTEAYMDRMNSFQEHNELLELPKFEEIAKKYGL